ncbi:YkgJ family cysteine cluster protein [Magnetofaba australis]|uniref:Uncharacterized protein n=1 Tax=Magnetofaba australis IT-1 TaxID=1434232 RepID=A0A1Y2JZ20_9PROT|nr:YkgJ family cysteine cluster protein [Magnetofaba australis]OSM00145.1 hypothetical protein MAIT1_00582 [Magnetofaba australis IT-1]
MPQSPKQPKARRIMRPADAHAAQIDAELNQMLKPDSAVEANRLCLACGLCCNGSIFSRVGIEKREVEAIAAIVPVWEQESGDVAFSQPCPAWTEGKCGLYAVRPGRCASYICKLQGLVMNGAVSGAAGEKIVDAAVKQAAALRDRVAAYTGKEPQALNLRQFHKEFHPKAMKKAKSGELTLMEQTLVRECYLFLKLQDRYFSETSLIKQYAFILQQIDYFANGEG